MDLGAKEYIIRNRNKIGTSKLQLRNRNERTRNWEQKFKNQEHNLKTLTEDQHRKGLYFTIGKKEGNSYAI